ncbi:gliding motility-associated C-terminal domain-containing protein [Pontibacter harenae]|uniref:Ig-like domain-containing protein n=1 Tax=Pontibacter harenae TaxID=2894083 RepID=UPI001E4D27E3|nr:gliding motility-associated C-terminal domain-containing protein [Pontibacter harenae]MCC9167357.1 gliding motility-associated C-terminal domain-containing protein [Pontibacter harenae]
MPTPLYKSVSLLLFIFYLLQVNPLLAQNCSVSIAVVGNGGTTLCQGQSVDLAGNATGFTATSWEWFRDGNFVSNSQTITVSIAGVYTVQATGADCDPATISSGQVEVRVVPTPAPPVFTVTPTTDVCGGSPITFEIDNPAPPEDNVVYTWVFGDGSTARGTSVTHTYEATGKGLASFEVQVYGTNNQGCRSTVLRQTVQVRRTPVISFTEENDFNVCLPDTVSPSDTTIVAVLTNTTDESLYDITRYFVDWGDGNGEVAYDPSEFPLESPNPYDSLRSYTINVRAVNANGCETNFTREFNVSQKPKANFTFNKEPEGTPPSCTPIIVSLGDSSTGGDLTYQWEILDQNNIGGWEVIFGDLESDSLQIRFENSGIFQIQLVVSNACGSDTTDQSVIVGWPQANLSGDIVACGDTTIRFGQEQVFFDPNFGNTVTYEWFVDGNQVSTEQYPELQFSARNAPYQVSVRITNECGSSDLIGPPQPINVTVYPVPGSPVVQDQTTCEGETVTITPTGPGTNYNWYNQPTGGTLLSTGASFTTPVLTGNVTYYVETISQEGCSSERVPVTVNVVPAIDNNTITPVSQSICTGGIPAEMLGSAPTGGAGSAYTYTWQVSTTGPTSGFALASGVNNTRNYTPTVISRTTWYRRIVSSGSCTADTSVAVQVEVVPAIQNNTIEAAQEICANEDAAPIIGARATGGTGTISYEWQISTQGPAEENFVPAPGVSDGENYEPGVLTQDTWIRRVAISGGCRVASEPVKITVYPELANNTISEDQEVCTGSAPEPLMGSEPTGGSGSYIYVWESSTTGPNGGFAPAAGTNNGQSYTPATLTQTTWFRRVVRSAACETTPSNVVAITINPGVTNNSIAASQEVCDGDVPATLTGSTPSGGNGQYQYLWESSITGPTVGFSPAGGNNTGQSYMPTAITQNTWFRRTVTSAGCSSQSEAVAITVIRRPNAPTVQARSISACLDSTVTLSVLNPNGHTYEWYAEPTGGNVLFVGPNFPTPRLSQTTTFYVQAVNENNCSSTTRTPVTVTVVEATADAGEDVTIIQGRTTELRARGGATYSWEPAEGIVNPNSDIITVRPDVTTTYTVTVTTAEGCTATDEVTVFVTPALVIPNAFTPNGDFVNELWLIENVENFPDLRVQVFNRWGNEVFSSRGYSTPWDGRFNGEDLPVATYYYIIYLNSAEKPISGNVTIIR